MNAPPRAATGRGNGEAGRGPGGEREQTMTQRVEVTERRRAPGSSAGQRRVPQSRTRAPAGAAAPAGTRAPAAAGTRHPAGAPAQATARTREATRVPAGTGPLPARTRPPTARPVPGRGATGAAPGTTRTAPPAQPGRRRPASESRTRFVFLVVALLGGGLLCLLLVNTILAAGAFKITALQQGNVALAQRAQALQAQITAEEAPAALAERARALGMVSPPLVHFLDLKTGRIISQPRRVPGLPTVTVPGYAP